MLVKWKIVGTLGVMFWVAMYLMEVIYGHIHIEDLKPQMPFEEEMEEIDLITDESSTNTPEVPLIHYILWTIFSLIASIFYLVFTKGAKLYKQRKREKEEILSRLKEVQTDIEEPFEYLIQDQPPPSEMEFIEIPLSKKSSSTTKIPRKIPTAINATTSTNLVEIVRDFKVKSDKKTLQSKSFAGNTEPDPNSSKEFLAIVKKAETLVKEKRQFSKKLSEFTKENKYLKQKLEEISGDKDLLTKRLDCANREIKMNTTSKKMTLEKLEEASRIIRDTKSRISKLETEKNLVEQKLKQKEDLIVTLKEKFEKMQKEKIEDLKTDYDISESVKQSGREIEEVETKLENLEKSLERMKSNNKTTKLNLINANKEIINKIKPDTNKCEESKDDISKKAEKEQFNDTKDLENNFNDSTTDVPVKDIDNFANDSRINLTPEKDTTPPEMVDYLEVESKNTSTGGLNAVIHTKLKSPEIGDYNENCESNTESNVSSIQTTSDSEYDLLYQPGIVSQSPAFQQFLLKVLEGPATPRSLLFNSKLS